MSSESKNFALVLALVQALVQALALALSPSSLGACKGPVSSLTYGQNQSMVTREGLSGPSYVKAENKDLNEDLFGPNFQADIHLIKIHRAAYSDRILSIVN